jgi:cystathionine beta-lyase
MEKEVKESEIGQNAIDLNQPISRLNTWAEKYDLRQALFGAEDVLPMWVADMDLPTPPFILDALRERLAHPILGYTLAPPSVYKAVCDWQAQHGYQVSASQILFTHNVANGLFLAVQALTQRNDAVLIMPPIYPPFAKAVTLNQRQLVSAPLVLIDQQYQIDWVAVEQAIQQHSVKLLLFCNPHNPSGRVWHRDELRRLAELCLRYQVIIVSDEIHSDLVYSPYQHTPMASLSADIAQQTLTLSSPGKTFNLAGLQIGYAIAANPQHKSALQAACARVKIEDLNLMALVALQAAYCEQGKAWRDALLNHFTDNINRLDTFLGEHFPLVKLVRPQASYLVWLDFRAMFADHQALKTWLIEQAKLGLNDGLSYGESGRGFMRINLAVPRSTLEQALLQLGQAAASIDAQPLPFKSR